MPESQFIVLRFLWNWSTSRRSGILLYDEATFTYRRCQIMNNNHDKGAMEEELDSLIAFLIGRLAELEN